ncbi:MAG: transcription elongation factor GreA [Actinomycetota bacterium]
MTDTHSTAQTWLTQDAYDRLQAELEEMEGPGRDVVVSRIQAAREEGDLKENGGYHAAKEEQGKLEARIRQLTVLLRDAKVGEAPVDTDRARAGTVVTIRFEGDDDAETFLLGSREEHIAGLQIYSPSSPLGVAVLGHGAGDVVTYQTPRGATMQVTVLNVEPFHA